jgi:hypothetical protein
MIRITKVVVLDQLQKEMIGAGLDVSNGLGMIGEWLFPYDSKGNPDTFKDEGLAQQLVEAHVPTRDITNDELYLMYAEAIANNDTVSIKSYLEIAKGNRPRPRVPLSTQ